MSCRRSSRLANKTTGQALASSNPQKSSESLLIFEENDAQHVSLRSGSGRTPRTPYQRKSQKRKRGLPVVSTAVHSPEFGRAETIPNTSPGTGLQQDTPKILTQSRFQNSVSEPFPFENQIDNVNPVSRENGSDSKNILSPFGDDSFLFAVNNIETNGPVSKGVVNDKIEEATNQYVVENCSTDMFGDDAEVLDSALLVSQNSKNLTTPTSRHKQVNKPRKLVKAATSIGHQNDFRLASEVIGGKILKQEQDTTNVTNEQKGPRNGKNKKKPVQSAQGMKPNKGKKNGKFKIAFTNRKAIRELANSASNELSKEDLSYMSHEEKLQLSSWGLPASILNNYQRKGITSLFPWQLECLENEKVLEGRNLLYSAPTSAGKTLVSEILMIKRVLELGRKAIMILPFVSVAREKVYSLQSVYGDAGVRVEGFMGSVNPPGGFKAVDIAVCTIEKANSLVNKLLEENALADLGTLVVDELHLIGDPHRGYLLELLLTKILYMTSVKNSNSENSMNVTEDASWKPRRFHIQVIGMSATLPNLDLLANWLNAELYITDFRPVPLKERLKFGDKLLDEELQPVRDVKLESISLDLEGDTDHIIYLTLETVLAGFSVLIFCPTKAMVEKTAERIAHQFFCVGNPTRSKYPEIGEQLRAQLSGNRIKTVLDQLHQCPGGVDEVLAKTVMFGIGYHHAGLTYENRDMIESAFKRGVLRVIVATSTLSAGVNLPARRVIITTPLFNGNLLDTMTYRQMCGRAGRNGIDSEGESILVCQANLKDKGLALYKGILPMVRSALLGDGTLTSSMKRALLEAIASGIAALPSEVLSYTKCTFLFHSIDRGLFNTEELSSSQLNKETTIEDCLRYLETQDFIRMKHYEQDGKSDEYMPTQLGSACLASSLSPDDGIVVYKELLKARECFVLENELHVIYQVTPIYVSDQLRSISWMDYLKIWENLDVSEKKVASLVGIQESFIIRAMIGTVSWKNPAQRADMAIHQRFFAALALSDLVNEKSLDFVAKKYSLSKGVLQNLQQAASTFAGMVTAFCSRLGWSNLELLLSQFQERLEFGVQRELCDLVRLDCLNGQRARILYDAGLKTVMELAAADPAQVEHILHKATPFKSAVHGGKENNVWMLGKESLTEAEAAQKIVQQARLFIQIELGQQGNIQFAFGNHDIPQLPLVADEKHQQGNIVREGGESDTDDTSSESESTEGPTAKKEQMGQASPNIILEAKTEIDSNGREVFKIECPFSQKPQELERLPRPTDINLEDSQDLFEDSFPEIIAVNLSSLYPKEKNASYMHPGNHFDDDKHGLKIDHFNYLQHSTPLHSTKSKNIDIIIPSSNHDHGVDSCSTFKNVASPLLMASETVFKGNVTKNKEFSDAMLIDLDGFESVFAESFNHDRDSYLEHEEETSVKMSESDVKALKVLAEDSNFESEELFPPSEPNALDQALSPTKLSLSVQNALLEFENFDEEDFILTQGPEVSDQNDLEELEMYGESSSETETSSSWKDSKRPELITNKMEGTVGKNKVFVNIVRSVDVIPDEFFSHTHAIGLGLKIVGQKKPSFAKQGIGARVIGKKANISNYNDDEQHSLAMYSGGDTIWVFHWRSESGIAVKKESMQRNNKDHLDVLLSRFTASGCAIVMFDCKDKLKSLLKNCDPEILYKLPQNNKMWDPRIAQWLWEFDDEDWNVSKNKLIGEYLAEHERDILSLGWAKEIVEAFVVWKVMNALEQKLMKVNLWDHFTDTEMPSLLPLLLMEMNGFGLDSTELSKLKRVLQFKSALLELRAYRLAGRQFNLASPKDIKQILFKEIGLKQPKSKGTGKDVLLKLDHELPGVIVEWRKVNNALQKVVVPFQQERNLETGRVHGYYSHFTVTGRVVMSDPSLQCIPRDFDIAMTYNAKEVEELKHDCKIKFGSKVATLFKQIDNELQEPSLLGNISLISMRNVFIPCSGEFTLLTADYSQLELRILAHLSQDPKLIQALNKNTDVFIEIASQWKGLPKYQITDAIRQEAKGVIYGVIYGMGIKTLSEQMEIDEREADRFVTQFMRTYPGISTYKDNSVKTCQQKGYVETMSGRRRYLSLIHSRNPHEKAKASRQAVNTQIQGSAADLVKTAMTRIHTCLVSKYPKNGAPIQWHKILKARRSSLSFGTHTTNLDNLVFFPILNLHDELIFEVRKSYLSEVAALIKHSMEHCLKLRVQLPVVIKTGESWGSLAPYTVNSEST